LQLGAQTPAEIALAIIAEAQAVLTQSDVVALRAQAGSIHRRAEVVPAASVGLNLGTQ
jgi:xanthine/CO dehydrogenase XdhC/CoxF family maturation factor